MDIGMGRRPRSTWQEGMIVNQFKSSGGFQEISKSDLTTSNNQALDSCSIESRRTLLACYLSCSKCVPLPSLKTSISRTLITTAVSRLVCACRICCGGPVRSFKSLAVSGCTNAELIAGWLEECLITLETSSEAAPSDRRLTAWVRVQRVMEECNNTFSLDDPGNTASLSDNRVQQTLKGYERQLESLRRTFSSIPGLINGKALCSSTSCVNLTILWYRFSGTEHPHQQYVPP